jgi:hypothetical protein
MILNLPQSLEAARFTERDQRQARTCLSRFVEWPNHITLIMTMV